ncbi:hypothetical protein CLOM_g17302, partial [Closterium sp. NIES-68]
LVQIRVVASNCHKTVFCTRYGSFEYVVMPFSLTNAPTTFQMIMSQIFSSLVDKCVLVYLDDIVIYNETREQQLKDLEAVFTLLQEHRLLMKGSKCEFLGHVISTKGVEVDPRKIETAQAWLPPTIDIPIGGVLFQDFGEGLQPIAYESQKLHPPERNYPIHDKEMLAIVHTFKVWRCYLTGADVTVRTDHRSLQYIHAHPLLNPRQIRWLDFMESNFHYTVTYKKGASNIADPRSRPSAHLNSIIIAQTSP